MHCWRAPAGGALGCGTPCRKPGRSLALQAHAKLKYRTNIAQNHSRKSVWVNIDYDRLYQQPSYNPGRLVGPLKLQPLPGRGRGLVAEREVPLAETVMVCEPVGAALSAPEGRELLPLHLAHSLVQMQEAGRLGAADRARLRLLYDGSEPDSPSSLRNRGASLDDLRKLEDKLRRAAEAPKKPKGKGFGAPPPAAAAASGSGIDTAALGEPPLTLDELSRLVTYNSWGNSFGDLGAAPLRKEPSQAIIGVWPEFALLNHSCAANTVVMSVGQLLLVQAAKDIPQGAEVTTCYLGDLVQAPLEQRREWLRGSYGFECECERCKVESSVPPAVSSAVTAAYQLATSDQAAALSGEAVGRMDRGALQPLEQQLAAAVERLEEVMGQAGLEEQHRSWFRSSAYAAYYALAVIRDLPEQRAGGLFGGAGPLGGGKAPFSDPAAPMDLAAVVEEVAPGSDLHLYLALESLSRSAEAYPRDDPRIAEATKACLRAHIIRYGRVSDGVLRELLMARSRCSHYLGRITLGSQQQGEPSMVSEPLFGAAPLAQLREAAAAAAEELAAAAPSGA